MGRFLLAMGVLLPTGLLAEVLAVALVVLHQQGPLGLPKLLSLCGLHLFAATALAEALRLRHGARGAWQLGLTLGLLLPGFGPLLVAVMVLRPPRASVVERDDLVSPMEYRKQQAEAQLAAEAERGHAGVDVEAIGDALKDEDRAKRLGAVEALRALENRQAVDMLGRSLKNTVFEVRYHAVEALAAINKKYSARIARAADALERDPSPARHRALGEVYFEYARLEMEDPSIQLHLYRNATEHLRQALQDGSEPDPELLRHLAASLEALGEHQQAWHTYRQLLERSPRDIGALLGTVRLHFHDGRFDQLPATCRRILQLGTRDLEQEYVDVLALWAEGPEALGIRQGGGRG